MTTLDDALQVARHATEVAEKAVSQRLEAAAEERRRMLALCIAECEQIAGDYSKSMMPDHANGAYACANAIRALMGADGGRRIIVLAPDDGGEE